MLYQSNVTSFGYLVLLWCILCSDYRLAEAFAPFDALHRCHIADSNTCPNSNVTFHLYTRDLKVPHRLDVADMSTIQEAPFAAGRPFVMLLHGYTGHRDFSPNTEIRPVYLRHDDYNIISVDYRPLAPEPCYVQAVRNLPLVARCTAQLIDTLIAECRLPSLNALHVIGFSLGAQASGMISNYLRAGRLKRITGLDPAKPLFVLASEDHRLGWRDATFVDIIHTDVLQRGILQPVGHADFYVNGGIEQPGCKYSAAESTGSFNHARAPQYYAESIGSASGFWGFQCNDWVRWALGVCKPATSQELAIMGNRASKDARGLYFVYTNREPPFAKGILPEFAIDSVSMDNVTNAVVSATMTANIVRRK